MNTKSFARFLGLLVLTAFCVSCGGGGDDDPVVDLTWHKDSDGDGYSDGVARFSSNRPVGYYSQGELIATEGDCDDNNATVHPGGVEIDGDGLDQDCDGFEFGGPSEVVYDWDTDRCEDIDIPDLPVRAFRDANNQVQLIFTHYEVRRNIGPDLNNVVHECDLVMNSHRDADPGNFNDSEWLASTYTEDGTTIYAIIHNQYHGWEHPGQCTVGTEYWLRCWYNGLTLAVSTNSGVSYEHPVAPPLHVIASAPVPYEIDQGPDGIFTPSNIVKGTDGYYYSIVQRTRWTAADGYDQWACLIRTSDLAEPDAWRFWDGSAFEGRFVNAYTDPIADPSAHVCAPIDRDDISDMHYSLTYSEYLEKYVLLGASSLGGTWGFYYSLSDDLIDWTPRKLVMETVLSWTRENPSDPWHGHPSLLDPDSTSRNFETVGKTAYLYYTRGNGTDGFLNRDLLRIPIEFFKE